MFTTSPLLFAENGTDLSALEHLRFVLWIAPLLDFIPKACFLGLLIPDFDKAHAALCVPLLKGGKQTDSCVLRTMEGLLMLYVPSVIPNGVRVAQCVLFMHASRFVDL